MMLCNSPVAFPKVALPLKQKSCRFFGCNFRGLKFFFILTESSQAWWPKVYTKCIRDSKLLVSVADPLRAQSSRGETR